MSMISFLRESLSYLSAFSSMLSGSGRVVTSPISAFIEPTNICNLKCPLCACGAGTLDRPRGRMSIDAFTRIVDRLPTGLKTLYLWGQGEPFLAPDFLSMVKYATGKGMRTVTSTNGNKLDNPDNIINSGLSHLIISLDGIDQQSYNRYRKGGDFAKVVANVKHLVEEKRRLGKGPLIELQYLLSREAVENASSFSKFAETLGADRIVYKTLQAASMEEGESFLPENIRLTRYRKGGDNVLEPDMWPLMKNNCMRIRYTLQIDWQGDVLPCCFDKNSEYLMGNLIQESFDDIWNGEAFMSFRRTFSKSGRIFPMCHDCTEGLKRIDISEKALLRHVINTD